MSEDARTNPETQAEAPVRTPAPLTPEELETIGAVVTSLFVFKRLRHVISPRRLPRKCGRPIAAESLRTRTECQSGSALHRF